MIFPPLSISHPLVRAKKPLLVTFHHCRTRLSLCYAADSGVCVTTAAKKSLRGEAAKVSRRLGVDATVDHILN